MEDPGSGLPDTELQAAMEFPVTASLGSMGPLLRQLQSRPKGVDDDKIQLLKDSIGGLCISLMDLSESKDAGFMAKWWMKEVRELCYDTEDYLAEVMKQPRVGARRTARLSTVFRAGSARNLEWRPQIGKKAQGRWHQIFTKRRNLKPRPRKIVTSFLELMARAEVLDDVSEGFKPVYAQAGISRLTPHQLPVPPTPIYVHKYAGGNGLVGVEEPLNKLAKLLAVNDDNQKQLKVVSILGFPGVGKTTMATSLYHNFRGKFQCRAFVRVSRTPDMIMILTSILSQIKAPQISAFPDAQDLIDNIRDHLQGKRYFIIIDDLWTTSAWNIISRAFPDDDCSSRILTTTGIEDISLASCGYHLTNIFHMSPLSCVQSRELFFGRVFGSEDGCPPDFRGSLYGIIKKCGGSPLATVSAANLVAWEPNLGSKRWEYIQDSLSSVVSTYSTSEGMKEVLNLIYNDLPTDMKTCLLHVGMYPEGYTIRKDDLVKQWVAEGFLNTIEGQDTEKIAGAYFDELVSRGILQAVDTNYNGEVLFCTVHQLVLDFIRDKSIEENFAITVDYFQSTLALPDKVRRLSVQFGGAKSAKIPEGVIVSKARSLLFCGFFKCVPSIADYGLLRVLILHIWADEDKTFDLTRIRDLFHLTYLNIECNITIKLPAKIRGLQYLCTLEVSARLSAVPSDIVHLEKLLHLRLPSESNLPDGVGRMTSLRTLGYFDIGSNSVDNVMDLGKLTNIQDLQLTCSTVQPAENLQKNMQHLGSILEKLSILQSITLIQTADSNVTALQDEARGSSMSISCDSLSCVSNPPALIETIELLPRIFVFPSLPKWFEQLLRLRILRIAVRKLWEDGIDILKALPALTALSLYVQTPPSERIVFDKAGFLVLKYFSFRCTVPRLKFEAGAMPNLLKLKLSFNAARVEQQDTPAISIEHLSALKEISTKIGGAGADAESAFMATIKNHPSNPRINVQLVNVLSYGEASMVTKEKQRITQDNDQVKEKENTNDSRCKLIGKLGLQTEQFIDGETILPRGGIHATMPEMATQESALSKLSAEPKLSYLKEITQDFSDEQKIGTGSFGTVYKGRLNGDEVAVKKLFPVHDLDDVAFNNEFSNLMKIQHKNIVRLLHYCYEKAHTHTKQKGQYFFSEITERALCFEYMKLGSLSEHISDESCKYNWPTTYKIIKGTCEGLHHLHKGRGEKNYIYHLDLKPNNILLDENLVPKIGDFGLSRLFGDSKTHETSKTKGTIGFMPPEYINHAKVTPKNDIFSLGVIIFYMLAGQKGYDDYSEALRNQNYSARIRKELIESVLEYWQKKMQQTTGYRWDESDILGVTKCLEIAMSSVHSERDNRPSTTKIVDDLEKLDAQIEEILRKDPKPLIGVVPYKKLTCPENMVNDLEVLKEEKVLGVLGKDIVVDPSLELCFPFEPKRNISCCMQLTNKAASFIAFSINTDQKRYRAHPNRGILPPCSKCYITVTSQAQEKAPSYKKWQDMAIVQATRVSEGFSCDKITEDFLKKAGAVDVVVLPIVYVALEEPLQE